MTDIYNPGICEVTKALVTPYDGVEANSYDITGIITAFSIQQSIARTSISGTITVLDTVGLLERMPIRGEETLDLKIKSYDLQTERELKACIYKIDNVSPFQPGNGITYTLHFLSKHTFDANLNYFIKSYNNTKGSDIVLNIFKKYYGQVSNPTVIDSEKEYIPDNSKKYNLERNAPVDAQRYFYLQETFGDMSVIIPRLSPAEAIGFICERSFSNETVSSSYRFFETFDGYHFVTDEWLLEKARGGSEIKSFNYNSHVDKNPEAALGAISSIEVFSNPRRVDVASEMMGGSYQNTILEIDLLRHKVNRKDYSYLQSDAEFIKDNKDNINLNKTKKVSKRFTTLSGNAATAAIDIHTEKFITDKFNADNSKRFMVIKDYTGKSSGSGKSRNNTFYTELAAYRNMYTRHLNSTQVTIGLKGRLDLNAGEVININVKEFDIGGEAKKNRQLSGRYLIHSISNVVESGVLNTVCQIVKYDYSDTINDVGEAS